MPMELLRELATQTLPLEVPEQNDADKLRVLCAAGLVAAFLPPTDPLRDRIHKPATALAITTKGRDALNGTLRMA